MFRLLFFVSLILKIVMFRDAVRRGVPSVWYWLIAFLPAGEVVYFFVYPFDDLRLRRKFWGWFQTPRERHEAEPNVDNTFRLAEALYEEGDFVSAESALEEVLRHSEYHKEALYLLGMARLQLEDYDGATRPLTRLRNILAGYRDYAAWLQLAYAHHEAGRPDTAIEELEHLVERSGRREHMIVLGEYLLKAGKKERAREASERCKRMPLRGDAPEWDARLDKLVDALA
jgi:hypothetical protein